MSNNKISVYCDECRDRDRKMANANMSAWSNWRSLYDYILLLELEDQITERTKDEMLDKLLSLKYLIPEDADNDDLEPTKQPGSGKITQYIK